MITIESMFSVFYLSVFPLILTKNGYLKLTSERFLIFLFSIVLFTVVLIVKDILARKRINKTNSKARTNISYIIFGLYVIWNFVSAIKSNYSSIDIIIGQSRYEGLLSFLLYSLAFYFASDGMKYTGINIISIAICGLIMGIIALFQQIGINILYPESITYLSCRFISTVGHEDLYSGFASIYIAVLVSSYILSDEKKWFDFIQLPSIFILCLTMLITEVETGKLGVIIPIFLGLPFFLDTKKHLKRTLSILAVLSLSFFACKCFFITNSEIVFMPSKNTLIYLLPFVLLLGLELFITDSKKKLHLNRVKIQRTIALVLCFILLVALIALFNYKGSNKTLIEASGLLHGNLTDRAGNGRGKLWKTAIKVIKANPVFGSGPGTYHSEFLKYYSGNDGEMYDLAHNDFLQIGACTGIVALVLYVSFIVSVLVQAVIKANKNSNCIVLAMGIVGFLVYSTFVFSVAIISPLFWVMMGLLVSEIKNTN